MEVKPWKRICSHVKAHVIESGEGGALNRLNPVIGHEEVFLPSHENEILVFEIISEIVVIEGIFHGFESGEFFPVLLVDAFVDVPFSGQEWMFGSDELSIEKGGKSWMIGC